MPWAITIDLDSDKTTNDAEVGTITGTYTEPTGTFQARPFVFSLRTEFKTGVRQEIRQKFRAGLNAEIAKRQREANLEAALATVLNS